MSILRFKLLKLFGSWAFQLFSMFELEPSSEKRSVHFCHMWRIVLDRSYSRPRVMFIRSRIRTSSIGYQQPCSVAHHYRYRHSRRKHEPKAASGMVADIIDGAGLRFHFPCFPHVLASSCTETTGQSYCQIRLCQRPGQETRLEVEIGQVWRTALWP